MRCFRTIFVAVFMFGLVSQAQQIVQSKVPLLLNWHAQTANESSLAHIFIKGDETKIKAFLQQQGGHYKYPFKAYHAVALDVGKINLLDSLDFVAHVAYEFAPGMPMLSQSLANTNTHVVHDGLGGLPDAYRGEGVVVGVIDAGIELQHPDFQDENGNTRIVELWDQTMGFHPTRTPVYGYGQVWDSADINAQLCPHQDQTAYFGHGTNTAGIAAGNGNALEGNELRGYAPEADLIVVSSQFNAVGWTNTVADAVHFIFERAEAMGKPCVINASLGTYLGSHDGTDLAAQAIAGSISQQPGRIMVCAAGNSGAFDPYHLGYQADADTHFTWFKVPSGSNPGNGAIMFEMYGDKNDFERVQFSIGADRTMPTYAFRGETPFDSVLNRLNLNYTEDLVSTSGNILAEVSTYADSLNGVYRLQFLIYPIDSVLYNYRLSITGSGRFDLWSAEWLGYRDMVFNQLPTAAQFPDIQFYEPPDNAQSMVSSWACLDKVITVGNYTNRNSYIDVDENQVNISGVVPGQIALTSSRGPSRKGLTKPEVAAPGDYTLTAGAFYQLNALLNNPAHRERVTVGGMHHRAGGTSSASPAVAGMAALFLEFCPNASWSDFRSAITTSAKSDQFTGTVPNVQWGHGKADGLALLKAAMPKPDVIATDDEFCAGDSVKLSLNQYFPNVLWSHGDTQSPTYVHTGNIYFAMVENDLGCTGYSDSVSVFKRPVPEKPRVVSDGDLSVCHGNEVVLSVPDDYGAYEWNNGKFTYEIQVRESGEYYCTVRNIYNCARNSDTVSVQVLPVMPKPTLELKSTGDLFLNIDTALAVSYFWILNGEMLETEADQYLKNANLGYYEAGYIDSNGCAQQSNPLQYYALGNAQLGLDEIAIWPNPADDFIMVSGSALQNMNWEIFDTTGRLVLDGKMIGTLTRISVEAIPRGVYLMRIFNPIESHTISLIK